MLQPTVTQRVRAFLLAEGVRLEPWATLDETHARLYALLAARRGDSAFWPALADLLTALVADAAAGGVRLPAPAAELLDRAEVDRLIADLRRAVPAGAGPDGSAANRFAAALAAPALCGFLLLGLAATAGCSGPGDPAAAAAPPQAAMPPAPAEVASPPPAAPADPQAAAAAPSPPPAAPADPQAEAAGDWFEGCSLARGNALRRALDRSALDAADKRALCGCFAELDRRWTNRLSYLFRNGRPAEIARALEGMIACCAAEESAADPACADVAKAHRAVQDRSLSAWGAALYKGVCFD